MDRIYIALVCASLLAACGPKEKDKDNNGTNNETTATNNETTATNNQTTSTNSSTNSSTNNQTTSTNNGTTAGTNNGTTSGTNNGTTSGTNNMTTGDARKVDVLMVIDNSGSMCGLQTQLRDNFRDAIEDLAAPDMDVRIGVTTTQMDPNYPLEPVAKPGQLQSTPQPIPGFDRHCHQAIDGAGNTIDGDYSPIREAVDASLACAEGVDPADFNWSDADIECAMYNMPQGCEITGVCGNAGTPCQPSDLFPDPATYRALPKVLEVRSYMTNGQVDLDELAADFACMSLVGTRGHGIERGLAAASLAVSPNLTGGTPTSPVDDTAPNHGLIREDSDFGLFFLTDENDCSDDGTLDTQTACGGDVCTFANIDGTANSPLLSTADLADEMLTNLRQSKDDATFDRSRVFVASMHGSWDRYDGPIYTDNECGMASYEGLDATCLVANGWKAWSGDRYERYLDAFEDGNTYPTANSDGDHRTGAVCNGDLSGPFSAALGLFAQ